MVEDDESIRELLCDVLSAGGFTLHCAEDGEQALALTASLGVPCVLLVDIHMPRLDGLGFLQRLRTREPQANYPVVVMSADPELLRQAEALGVDAAFSKPFSLEPVVAAIRRLAGATG